VPGATLTTLSSILKDYYLPTVAEQMNNEVLLAQRLEPSAQDLFGNQAVIAVHKGRNTGIGPAAENAALPAAGNQDYARAVYNLIYMYGRIRVTGPGMAKTASQAGAYLQMLKSELDGIRVDLQKDFGRQTYGSGWGNGLIAKCGTTTAANVVVLSSAESLLKGDITVGMIVDIGTSPGATSVATARTVTDVSISAGTITISGAVVTTSSSHFVARSGAGAAEITGLTEIVSTTAGATVGGINSGSAGNSYWDNARLMNSGTPRALSLSLLSQAYGLARVNGADVSLMTGSFGLERALFELLQSQVRYSREQQDLKGGYKSLDFQGKPFVGDVQHPFGRIHVLTESDLRLFSNRDWHFLDEDGDVLKWVTGFDAYEAVLARYVNLGTARRNRQIVLGDLTDTQGY
jgi:hypothetical protein